MLTDTKIRAIKPGSAPIKVSDSGGLHLLVTPAGGKLWKLAFRFGGRQKTLSLGPYPQISLADARTRRETAKAQLRQGEDPSVIIQVEKLAAIAATSDVFSAVAAEWKQRKLVKEKKSKATLARTDWLLRTLNDSIGSRPINEVTAPELLKVLRKVEAQGLHETVARLRSVASRIFRYGIATGKCDRDVAADLRGATTSAVSTPHAAIIDPAGIGELLRKIDGLYGDTHSRIMRLAFQLLAYTFVRPGELRFAEWSEIDGAAAVWDIPAMRTKMKRPHRVPLARQSVAAFDELRALTGAGRYAFASTIDAKQPFNKNAFNNTLRRLGYTHDDQVAHGFRALASTSINEMNRWPVDVIERQLAHQERNAVRRVYNRATHWPERVAMMQVWADYLDELRGRGKVVALPKTKRRKGSAS
jgi:integrase